MKNLFFIFSWSCLISLCVIGPTNAQNKDKPIDDEDVAIAFYKTAGIAPNVSSWIKDSKLYQHTPAARRPKILENERNRIIQKYKNYDVKDDILLIQTKVNAIISETELINGNLYQLTLSFVKAPDAFYFPYHHAKNNFAIMPYGLKRVMEARVTKQQYDFLKANINSNKEYPLTLKLRSKEAVSEKPYKLSGISQWILKADIGSIELRSDANKSLLWEKHADWYIAPQVEMINKLYDSSAPSRQTLGTIKTFKE